MRDAVDLVVVSAMRKGEHLEQEAVEPFGLLGQVDMAGFDLVRADLHAVGLAAFGLLADGVGHAGRRVAAQILQQGHAWTCLRSESFPHRTARQGICHLL